MVLKYLDDVKETVVHIIYIRMIVPTPLQEFKYTENLCMEIFSMKYW